MTKEERKIVLGIAQMSAKLIKSMNILLQAQPVSDNQTKAIASLEDAGNVMEETVALMVKEWGNNERS
jgi:hypothetical protein